LASSSPTVGRAAPARALSGRTIAREALTRVLRDQAFAAAALDSLFSRHVELNRAERGLATELVLGTLRVLPGLEFALSKYAPKGLGALEVATRASLLIAAYQLVFLDRIPAYAAVSECVRDVEKLRGRGLSGFCNAILRKLSADVAERKKIAEGPGAATSVNLAENATEQTADGVAPRLRAFRVNLALRSTPAWLKAKLTTVLGPDGMASYLHNALMPAPANIHVLQGFSQSVFEAAVAERQGTVTESPQGKLQVFRVGDLSDLPGFEVNWFSQEEGSQWIARALDVQPGDRVLDVCAGRGQKSLSIGSGLSTDGMHVGPAGTSEVVATDLYPEKVALIAERWERLLSESRPKLSTFAIDWSKGHGPLQGEFDRVLVDAPCSGIGTLRRRPDIQVNRSEADIQELQHLQRAILFQAAKMVRLGGRLVYAVCSILEEEAEDVLAQVFADLGAEAKFEPTACFIEHSSVRVPRLAARSNGAPSSTPMATAAGLCAGRFLPHVHGTDGYFLATFTRVR
jgi:16S rRNA (cytosine967-C5)-methyltransferase